MSSDVPPAYRPRRIARQVSVPVRGLALNAWTWGDAADATPGRPTLVLAHGWMDMGASFQFMVDAMADRRIVAPDWRGFGGSEAPAADCYWFPDYLGDLDALLRAPELGLDTGTPVDLLGHSMGGNIVMTYAGVRPGRIRRLVNAEGFGLPDAKPDHAPKRLAQWLDELAAPVQLRSYDSLQAVAARLRANHPRLDEAAAAWLAPHWAALRDDGRWHVRGDPAHRRVNPVPYRRDEVLAAWRAIAAPVLWIEGALTDFDGHWGERYTRAEFDARLAQVPTLQRRVVAEAGHMLHYDQPQALARAVEAFLDAAAPGTEGR